MDSNLIAQPTTPPPFLPLVLNICPGITGLLPYVVGVDPKNWGLIWRRVQGVNQCCVDLEAAAVSTAGMRS
jgi:hypothetical protein